MTSGGLTMTEGWNLQLQGRVRKLEEALRFYADPSKAKDEYGDPVQVPDFYSELDFGSRATAALATVSEAEIAATLGEEPPPKTYPVPEQLLSRLGRVAERMRGRVDVIVERAGSIDKAITGPGVGISYLLAKEIFEACRAAADVMEEVKS